jgi:hypothetical protein
VIDLADIKDVSIFAEHVGGQFRIEIAPDQFVTAKLTEASAIETGSRGAHLPPREPFSLLFEVDRDIDLPQRTYIVRHELLGELGLFLTPVGDGRLETIFN